MTIRNYSYRNLIACPSLFMRGYCQIIESVKQELLRKIRDSNLISLTHAFFRAFFGSAAHAAGPHRLGYKVLAPFF